MNSHRYVVSFAIPTWRQALLPVACYYGKPRPADGFGRSTQWAKVPCINSYFSVATSHDLYALPLFMIVHHFIETLF